MENRFQNYSVSLFPIKQNIHCIDWGPDGYLCVCFEHLVFIYKFTLNEFKLIHCITQHKSNITCVKFAPTTIEISNEKGFQLLLAVADEAGNCIIYNVFDGSNYAGFSPQKQATNGIVNMIWNPVNYNLFVLTQDKLICINIVKNLRRYSDSWNEIEDNFYNHFNTELLFVLKLTQQFQFLIIEKFNYNYVVLANKNGYYIVVRINVNGNPRKFLSSAISNFKGIIIGEQQIIGIDSYPNSQNRLIIITSTSMFLYDLQDNTSSFFYQNSSLICYGTNIFHPHVSNEFWVTTIDGSVSRFQFEDNFIKRKNHVYLSSLQKLYYSAADPFNPFRIVCIGIDGKIIVIEEKKSKLFIVGYLPSVRESIVSWTANENRITYITNKGYVVINDINYGNLCFLIKDKELKSVESIGNTILVCGSEFYSINLANRTISRKLHQFSPKNLTSNNSIIAYNPLPNILDIMYPNSNKQTISFLSDIVAFNLNQSDKTKWCIILADLYGIVIDVSKKPKSLLTFSIKSDIVSSFVFIDNYILIASKNCKLLKFDFQNQKLTTKCSFDLPLKSISFFDPYILITDIENNPYLVDFRDYHIIKTPKWKLINAKFVCSDKIIIQTSNISFRILSIPTFNSIEFKSNEQLNGLKDRFLTAKTFDELKEIGYELGDQEFIQLIQIINKEEVCALPSIYTQNKLSFIEKERVTTLIESNSHQNNYIEFLILTNQIEKATELLLKSQDETKLVLAYSCISPNITAAKKIQEFYNGKDATLISQLLYLSGDKSAAIQQLILMKEWMQAITFIKLLCDCDEIFPLYHQLIFEVESLQKSYIIFVFIGDYHAALHLLNKNNQISKAYVYLKFTQENNIEIKNSKFTDFLELKPIQEIIAEIESKWKSFQNNK